MCAKRQGITNGYTRSSLTSRKSTRVSLLKNRRTNLHANRNLVIFLVKTKAWWESLKSWRESIVSRRKGSLRYCKALKVTSHLARRGTFLRRDSARNYSEQVTKACTWCEKSKLRNKKSYRLSRNVNAELLRMNEHINASMSCSKKSENCRTAGKLVPRLVQGCNWKSTSTKQKFKT